jgi:hypothetical protein
MAHSFLFCSFVPFVVSVPSLVSVLSFDSPLSFGSYLPFCFHSYSSAFVPSDQRS